MVFNWFRRQFGSSEGSAPETSSENPEVEQEQKAPEQPEQPAEVESAESPVVAEDYLIWAKAAYKNIQKQQQLSEEASPTATESVEVPQEDESADQPGALATPKVEEVNIVPETAEISAAAEEVADAPGSVDTAQPTDTEVTTRIESEELEAPETSGLEQTPLPTTDVSESEIETATTESVEVVTEEGLALVEPVVAESEVDAIAQAGEVAATELTDPLIETTTLESEALTEAQPPASDVAASESQEQVEVPEAAQAAVAIDSEPPAVIPEEPTVVESDSEAASLQASAESAVLPTVQEAPSAPVPIWARNADRQARLERLKETAIERPELEPVRTPVQPVTPAATTTVEVEEVPGLAFDEGFLWSAEVLAAQGRRPEDVSIEEISWLKRLRQGLDKTRRNLINQLKAIVGQGPLNQDAVMEIEALLLQADVGVEATDYIISTLQQKLREEVLPPEQAIAFLKQIIRDLLDRPSQESYSPTFVPEKDTLNIWLMVGVNGVGKTTTIGKLARLASKSGYRCLIGAADTFRAAAVEQVKIWGERSGIEVIANPGKNTDPAAVVFDAIAAAQARNIELLLVDTAGRLQNKKNLMEELAKIRRIVDKKAPDAKVEALLVLDATLGQNGLRQAEVFSQAAKLSGVVLTKLDGTAKGGVALAVVQQLGLPIRFIGAGEGIEDLRPFSSYEFVEALLSG